VHFTKVESHEVHSAAGSEVYRAAGGAPHYWVITSPNSNIIPKPVMGIRTIRAMKDGRFGMEDRTLHPQYYIAGFEYFCCIPRRPRNLDHPLAIMWFTPMETDVSLLPGVAFDVFIYTLNKVHMDGFRSAIDELVRRARQFEKSKGHAEMLSILETAVCHCYTKLEGTGMVLKEIVLSVAELQRLCLDMYAWLDYFMIFYPRQFPTSGQRKYHEEDRTRMGAFTEEVLIAEQLLMMGIQVWLIRPSFAILPDTTIKKVVKWEDMQQVGGVITLRDWEDHLGRKERFPTLYEGRACQEMFRSMQRIGCRFTDLVEVTRISASDKNGSDDANEVGSKQSRTGEHFLPLSLCTSSLYLASYCHAEYSCQKKHYSVDKK
jgi:hypothetical protein